MQYDQLIYDTAIRNGFTPTSAKFVVGQARYECSDYTSAVFNQNNNTSGMKYVGQPLATRGTLAPYSERSPGCQSVTKGQVGGQGPAVCRNSDHYAKYKSVEDSVKDKIERNFNITRGGVSPQQLKDAKTPEEFAHLLKLRGYFGGDENSYAAGLKSKLRKIAVSEIIQKVEENKTGVLVGLLVVSAIVVIYKYQQQVF